MAIFDLSLVVGAIVEMGFQGVWEKAKRREAVIKVLNKVGLNPKSPPSDFDGVYVYTLVEYGIGKPKPILDFFRHEFIRDAFYQSFEKRDLSILNEEAHNLIEWHQVGNDLRRIDVDPRREFARFTAVFNEIVDRTRAPAEVRREQKLGEIVERLEKLNELDEIRAELARLAQSHQASQSVGAPTGEEPRAEPGTGKSHSGAVTSRTQGFHERLRRALLQLEPQMLEAMWFDLTEGKWGPLEGATQIDKVIFLVKHFRVREELSGVYDWIEHEASYIQRYLPPLAEVSE